MLRASTVRSGALAAFVCGILAFCVGVPAAEAVETDMTISTTSIDFGEVTVGNTGGPISVTLTNTGGDPFGPITIFGGAPPTPEFNASQNCQSSTLPAGGSCTVSYTFSPTGPGVFNDFSSFTISETSSQSDGEDFSVTLTGTGVPPIGVSHDFGSVAVGRRARPDDRDQQQQRVELRPDQHFRQRAADPGVQRVDNCQGTTLTPGAACIIDYTFSPTAAGTFNDTPHHHQRHRFAGRRIDFTVTLTGCGAPTPRKRSRA